MTLLFSILLGSALAADPALPGPGGGASGDSAIPVLEEASPAEPFELLAAQAKAAYFRGDHEAALAQYDLLWERVQGAEIVDQSVIADVAIYRGEVQYQLRQRTEAWNTFAWLLRRDPDALISPVMHPGEVVHWFELVRKRVRQEIAQKPEPPVQVAPPPRMPLPLWGYLPFGTPQFKQKRVGAGIAWGGSQLALAGVSIGAFIYLNDVNQSDHPPAWADEDVAGEVNLRRYLVQWPATLGFYGLWLGSHLAARRTWRKGYEVTLGLQVGERTGIRVSGRF